eukprot:gene4547-6418_t
MSAAKVGVYIIGAKRTAFGSFGGSLKSLTATKLAAITATAALEQAKLDSSKVDETFYGNVISSSLDAPYLSRHAALMAGVPIASPALTLNRLCGSGFEAVCLGVEAIIQGRSKVTLCGGSENMSQAPMAIDGLTARWGATLGNGIKAEDTLWAGLTDSYAKLPMGMTAEKLAEQYSISRLDCDEYALRSQLSYQKANEAKIFDLEICPVEVKGKKGIEVFKVDEHPRANSTLANLQKLPSVFKKDVGVVTAGSASGICDGAASLIVASEESLKLNNSVPLARIVAWCRIGCDPSIMGIGPVEAIKGALRAANLTLQDMDIIEINEAFAAQYLACEKALQLDRSKVNINGGAIAIGHPLGTSGARILSHITHQLTSTGKKYGIGAACIGGGQGIAVILQNANK